MKNRFFWFVLGLTSLLLVGAKITTDVLKVGNGTGEDITIEFDIGSANNPVIKWDDAGGVLKFSNDGTNFFDVGSGTGGGGAGINMLGNGNIESGLTDWSATGGTLTEATISTDVGHEGKSLRWLSSATGDQLNYAAVNITNSLKGRTCLMKFDYRWNTGTYGDLKGVVNDGSNDLFTPVALIVPPTGKWGQFQAAFQCPSSGTLIFRIVDTSASSAAEILIDDGHLGTDFRAGVQNDAAELISNAVYQGATGTPCEFVNTNTVLSTSSTFTESGTCPAVTVRTTTVPITTTENNLPDLVYPDLPPGKYEVNVNFIAYNPVGATIMVYGISDGSTIGGKQSVTSPTTDLHVFPASVTGTFTHSGGPKTFTMVAAENSNAGGRTAKIIIDSTERQLEWVVKRFPSQSARDTVTLETQGWFISGNIGGADAPMATTGSENVTNNAAFSMELDPGSAAAKITCSGPNPATGLTCSAGNEQTGIEFIAPYAGQYEICFDGNAGLGADAAKGAVSVFSIYEFTPNSDTIINRYRSGYQVGGFWGTTIGTNQVSYWGFHPCIYPYLTEGPHAFKLVQTPSVASPTTWNLAALRSLTTGRETRSLMFKVMPITQRFPQAVVLTDVPTLYQQRDFVDYSQYFTTGGFGPSITTLKGVEIPIANTSPQEYVSTAGIAWTHSSGFSTQRQNVTGITLLEVIGHGSDSADTSVQITLSGGGFFMDNGIGDNLVQYGTVFFRYRKN